MPSKTDNTVYQKLQELCAKYIVGVINYEQLIARGKRLGFSEAEIRKNADDPQY